MTKTDPTRLFNFLLGQCLKREPRAHVPTLRAILAERLDRPT